MTEAPFLMALDAGTTSTRAIVFDRAGRIVAQAGRPVTQHYPQPGWVEHDAAQIWTASLACLRAAVAAVGLANIAALGLTNQRETVVFWDRDTGEPLAPAIVWQDRRTADICETLRDEGLEAEVQETTGLLLDPYFSGTKIGWAMTHTPAVRAAAQGGQLLLGTIDSWLLWKLTGGTVHATDATNASRTMLMNLASCGWDAHLLTRLGVPVAALPAITDCAGPLGVTTLLGGRLAITGCAGDQHAAAIGQGCFAPGDVKATYGTGIFVLAHAGATVPASDHRLLATLAWRLGGIATYALEGSIFTGGAAVQWLRDGLGIIGASGETEALARSVPDSGGVTLVPAFAGLGAPYWRPEVRGLVTGITGGTTRAHLARATLEAMGQQTADLLDALAADGVAATCLRVDGGMTANDWLCQDLADAIGLPVERPAVIETTALGAAMLAGVGAGVFATLDAAGAAMQGARRRFEPALGDMARAARRATWAHAVRQALAA